MATNTRVENCPNSVQTPPAVVDDDGFCSEHGWDCDDFGLYLREEAELAEPVSYSTSSDKFDDDEEGDDDEAPA